MNEDLKYKAMLPSGWAIIDFAESCEKISLNGIKIKQKQYLPEGKYPVVDQGQELIGGYFDDDKLIVPSKPPYVIFGDHTRVKKYINFKFIAGADGVKVLKPFAFLNEKLFFYFLHCIKLPDKGYARHLQFLEKADIPLPPLPEQHRIVAKIEELFSSLDKGIESLKTAQQQLKVYRQAVLKWAFEGNWGVSEFGKIAEIKRGKSKHRPRDAKELFGGPYPFIQTGEIRAAKGGIVKTYSQTYSEVGLAQSKLWIKGTLCLTIAANIAETAFLGFDACFPDSIVGIKTDEKKLSINFVNYYVQKVKQEIDSKASATAQKNINVEILEKILIPIPPIEEQHAIVAEIESRLSVCDKIEESIEHSLKQAEALRQSILKKAFEGRLVPQDPNDEPASVLLERIKAERESNKAEILRHRQPRKIKAHS